MRNQHAPVGSNEPSRGPVPAAGPIPALVFLVVATLLLYWPVQGFNYVYYDDPLYVAKNPRVLQGLTGDSLRWAFTSLDYGGNWHPLTWISHMADVQFFGSDPGRHHLTNLFFHLANTAVLFLVLHAMTGAAFKSAVTAGLFAAHPLHVESVAWIAERKDVLSAFFLLLALGAYLAYVRRPGLWRYLAVAALFMLGLSAKPSVITLPLILILLDYWPLGRRPLGRAAWEKIPLLVPVIVSMFLTLRAQGLSGVVLFAEAQHLQIRAMVALISYVRYLGKFFQPFPSVLFYPFPMSRPPAWQFLGAGAVLVALSAGAVVSRRRAPAVTCGWIWFLVTMFPMIGLVKVGAQAIADRYTYVPFIGLTLLLVWGGAPVISALFQRRGQTISAGIALVLLAAAAAGTRLQLAVWRDGRSLFQHNLQIYPDLPWMRAVLEFNTGEELAQGGKLAEAERHFLAGLQIDPRDAVANFQLGKILLGQGRIDPAVLRLQAAVRLRPAFPSAHYLLGTALEKRGALDQARFHFRETLRLKPDYPDADRALQRTGLR